MAIGGAHPEAQTIPPGDHSRIETRKRPLPCGAVNNHRLLPGIAGAKPDVCVARAYGRKNADPGAIDLTLSIKLTSFDINSVGIVVPHYDGKLERGRSRLLLELHCILKRSNRDLWR